MTFTIPGIPVAQPRQRHTVRNGFVANYMPTQHPVNAFKAAARQAASVALRTPFDGPVELWVVFVLPRPKSKMWKKRDMPREAHVSKPDCDNLLKAVQDALNGLAWRDDAQVWSVSVSKLVASGTEQPHTDVTIRESAAT